jgi:hypothetical protein
VELSQEKDGFRSKSGPDEDETEFDVFTAAV